METYTKIDDNTILISVSTPVIDGNGNSILDGDGNPITSVSNSILTLDQANLDLQNDTEQLNSDNGELQNIQNDINRDNAAIALNNARINAFSQSPSNNYSIQKI